MFPAADSVLLRFLVPASMLFRLPVSVLFRFLFMLTVSVLFRFLFMFPDPVPVSELLRLFDANISDSSEVSEIFRFLDDDDDDKSELDFWFLIFWTIPNNFWKFEFLRIGSPSRGSWIRSITSRTSTVFLENFFRRSVNSSLEHDTGLSLPSLQNFK